MNDGSAQEVVALFFVRLLNNPQPGVDLVVKSN